MPHARRTVVYQITNRGPGRCSGPLQLDTYRSIHDCVVHPTFLHLRNGYGTVGEQTP